MSEPTVHAARENGIHFYAAGHHATERYGVQALGEHLAQVFGVQHEFIDIDNPVWDVQQETISAARQQRRELYLYNL